MAKLGQAFDSSQHDDMGNFDPIPPDVYVAKIVESDILENKKKNGKYIKFKFEIIKGEFKGRFIWNNLNIINPSSVAVEIAQKELATICRSVGKAVVQDTKELHGIPLLMQVKIRPAKGDYPASNAPCGYKPISGSPGSATGPDPSDEEYDQMADMASDGDDGTSDEVPWPDDDIPF